VYFHDAVDPALEFDYAHNRWRITDPAASLFWAESKCVTRRSCFG
jgi:hypothetical protein